MKAAIISTNVARFTRQSLGWGILILTVSAASFAADITPADTGEMFASAESAVDALASAARAKDRTALRTILGPASEDLQVSDKVQADQELTQFATAYDLRHRIVSASKTNATLEVGTNDWDFPIPIVQNAGKWSFDTADGVQEIINRRVGRNELSTLATVRACVDAQREYASRDRDGSEVLKYAQKILSSPGKKDGLYWPMGDDGEMSPLGPLIADAQGEGYLKPTSMQADAGPRPYHGYRYTILKAQGSNAPGGKYDYVINGNMIGGFALVAWPADYGDSGVMTFIVNQQGKVYQKDLGEQTESIAPAMTAYDPDKTWTVSPD